MKKNNRTLIYPLIIIGFVLILIISCQKDEISKKVPVITWTDPADITYGTLLSITQLNATTDVSGSFVYTPAIGTKLNVGNNQDLKVDFTPTDVTVYNSTSKTVKINVAALPTVTDYDGNVYPFVVIGTQTWMIKNLKVTHYRNGDPIDNVTDTTVWPTLTTGAYCLYNHDVLNEAIYGALYNWYAVDDARKIAPIGWHVPSDEEYTILTNYLGGEYLAGGKMKKTGTGIWWSPNTGATNESGFSALPGGYSNGGDGSFYGIGRYGYWWTSTEADASTVWRRNLDRLSTSAHRAYFNKSFGYSVRCIKD